MSCFQTYHTAPLGVQQAFRRCYTLESFGSWEVLEAAKTQGIDAIHFINPQQLKEELERRGFNLE